MLTSLVVLVVLLLIVVLAGLVVLEVILLVLVLGSILLQSSVSHLEREWGVRGQQARDLYSQGLINAVLFAPILMDLFAKPTQGVVEGAASTVPGGNFHPMVQVGDHLCRTSIRRHLAWRPWN